MTKNFGKDLVDLSGVRLSANAGSELGLDHVERRFNVRPLMVVREELLAIVDEKLVHLTPQLPTPLGDPAVAPLAPIPAAGVVVALEGYQRKRASAGDGVEVGVADVAFVSGDRLNVEPLGGRLEERG